jgi:hypothetical protein
LYEIKLFGGNMPIGNMDDIRKSYLREWEIYLHSKGLSYNKMMTVICRKNIYAPPPK